LKTDFQLKVRREKYSIFSLGICHSDIHSQFLGGTVRYAPTPDNENFVETPSVTRTFANLSQGKKKVTVQIELLVSRNQ
jgi:hypothetical protein